MQSVSGKLSAVFTGLILAQAMAVILVGGVTPPSLAALVILVGLSVVAMMLLRKSLLSPLNQVRTQICDIAEGRSNLSKEVCSKTDDEVGVGRVLADDGRGRRGHGAPSP